MTFLTHTHSGLRWIALVLLVYAIYNAFTRQHSGNFSKKDKLINLLALISLHIQLILGLLLYATSGKVNFGSGWMKQEMFRFYGLEHFIGMLVAIVLVTIGYSKAKRIEAAIQKHKLILRFYLLGFLLILVFIPWPFRIALGGSWF
jgi:hypothetical protein